MIFLLQVYTYIITYVNSDKSTPTLRKSLVLSAVVPLRQAQGHIVPPYSLRDFRYAGQLGEIFLNQI